MNLLQSPLIVAILSIGIIKLLLSISKRIQSHYEKRMEIEWPILASQKNQATQFYDDLWWKIYQMHENAFTMDSDWRNLLPVCQYADEWYKRTNPKMPFYSRAEIVRGIIQGDEIEV